MISKPENNVPFKSIIYFGAFLRPFHIVYANNVIDDGGIESHRVGVNSGGDAD